MQSSVEAPKNIVAADLIRVVATVAVLGVHVSGLDVRATESYDASWWSLAALETLSIFAVPAFVMLSGALLLPRANSGPHRAFYRRRLSKIGVPLVFWIGLHLAWIFSDLPHIDTPSKEWFVDMGLLKTLAIGQVSWHLYFLYLIAGLYVITPYLRVLLAQLSRTEEFWLVVGVCATDCLAFIANMHLGQGGLNVFTQWLPYVGYFLAGHYVVTHAKWGPKSFGVLALVGVSLALSGKYLEMRLNDGDLFMKLGGYSSSYSNVAIVMYSVGIVGALLTYGQRHGLSSRLRRICAFVAPATFGVYLSQLMVWTVLRESFGLVEIPKNALEGLWALLAVGGGALAITYLIGLVPILRATVDCNTQEVLRTWRS